MTLKQRLSGFTAILLMVVLVIPAGRADAAEAVKTYSSPISAGVVQETYQWQTSYGNIMLRVLKCDLTNPGFDMKLIPGAGEYTRRATVSNMATRTDAVALTNGDFFNTALQGAPIGPSMLDGRLASSPAVIIGLYSLGVDSNRKARIEPIIFYGSVTAADGTTFPIDGLNKTNYWHDPSGAESHTDTIQMYNDFWGSPSRGHRSNSEVLVNADGIVERIDYGNTLPYEVPDHKTILQVNGAAETFIRDHVAVGDKITIDHGVSPNPGWTFLVGGHALVADNYQMVPYTKDLNALGGVRARTFAGVSEDGNTLWLVTAEGRTSRSAGITLSSMGYFMQQLGVYRAVNLDGGGSTTMVSKPLGAFQHEVMTYPEGYGAERPVVNGIAIFNEAPQGPISGLELKGPKTMVVGESGMYEVVGAWDANYHPHDPNEITYEWQEQQGLGAWGGAYFLALQPGATTVQAIGSNGVVQNVPLTIQGSEAITSLRLVHDQSVIHETADVNLSLEATLTDGRTIGLSPQVATWHMSGFDGQIDGISGWAHLETFDDIPIGYISAQIGDKQTAVQLYNGAFHTLDLRIGQTTLWVNGESSQMDVAPHIIQGRTMVPLRFVTQALGGDITWHPETRRITLMKDQTVIEMGIDETIARVNGTEVMLDSPAIIVADRTFVPIRFVSEALGMQVDYDDTAQRVRILDHYKAYDKN